MQSNRTWNPLKASIYGLAFQIILIWLSDQAWGAVEWGRLTFELDSGVWQSMTLAIAALLPGPCLFGIGAWFRNSYVVHAAKSGSQQSPNTMAFRRYERQAPSFSTAVFMLALTFVTAVLAAPPLISQIEQFSQALHSTSSAALVNSTSADTTVHFHWAQNTPANESNHATTSSDSSHATNSSSPPLEILVQKGTVDLVGKSPVEVTFPKRFGGAPNVVVVNAAAHPGVVVEDVTPNSFEIRQTNDADDDRSDIKIDWVAQQASSK